LQKKNNHINPRNFNPPQNFLELNELVDQQPLPAPKNPTNIPGKLLDALHNESAGSSSAASIISSSSLFPSSSGDTNKNRGGGLKTRKELLLSPKLNGAVNQMKHFYEHLRINYLQYYQKNLKNSFKNSFNLGNFPGNCSTPFTTSPLALRRRPASSARPPPWTSAQATKIEKKEEEVENEETAAARPKRPVK
jgi:hypothetical protein